MSLIAKRKPGFNTGKAVAITISFVTELKGKEEEKKAKEIEKQRRKRKKRKKLKQRRNIRKRRNKKQKEREKEEYHNLLFFSSSKTSSKNIRVKRMWWALIEEIAPRAEEMAGEKEIASCVRGYHVYNDIWAAAIREVLVCSMEPTNVGKFFVV